ncbi:fibronectin type III domain-containing protein [Candidatus Uabimicrobium amorphum]|uniref:Uncharacterized protein n=1 Tax=Uabimicrobium amorphum TaxID=2596890 RepID=A0A5S9F2Q1_UABAM|nr:fibronectin type III domain-containing protein [Candidatus Uabimicrobium amorphum]BBM83678.1 hypothetical protein UABAM_02031 [Candidatus Uabimicrobium amorphum]
MKDMDPKELLVQYGHILAFVVCIAFNGFWFMKSGDEMAERLITKVDSTQRKLKRKLKEKPKDVKAVADYSKSVVANWSISKEVSQSPGYQSIYPSANITFEHEVPPEDQWINKPSGISIKIGKEKITVNWKRPTTLRKNGKVQQMTKIEGYQLIKNWKDRDGKDRTKEFLFRYGKTSLVDKKVETKTLYTYKVRAYSYNAEAKGGKEGKIKDKKAILSDFTKTVQGKIKSLYEIELLGVAGDSAFVKLRRYYRGSNRETTCNIKKGQEIQALNVKVKGLKKRINFTPGWKLINLTTRAQRKKMVKEKVFSHMDKVTKRAVYKTVEKPRLYETPAIIYIDEKKQQVKAYQKK